VFLGVSVPRVLAWDTCTFCRIVARTEAARIAEEKGWL